MRKTAKQLRLSGSKRGTKRELAARKDAEAPKFLPGRPARPEGMPRSQRRAWNSLCDDLSVRRVLAESDGPKLEEILQCRADAYKGSGARRKEAKIRLAILLKGFNDRTPFPEEKPSPENDKPKLSLADFLLRTETERQTFAERMIPGRTICLDLLAGIASRPYEWPEGDAATVARRYCTEVLDGTIPACDLLRRACARHLADLETGASRGCYFDPVACRNITTWFAEFCSLPLEPWEVFLACSIFGWKMAAGQRRFRECWIFIAKKNGKTAFAAGAALFCLLCDGERQGEVYTLGVKKEQARLAFRDAKRYITANAELRDTLEVLQNSIVYEDLDASFQPLSADTRSLDGLRTSVLICDELHEWDSRENFDKVQLSTVSRVNPLVLAISTAGEEQQGFAWDKYEIASKILRGVFADDRTFCAIWELDAEDDYKLEANWIKSNPNIGVSVKWEAMRQQFAETEQDPSALTGFLRYQCNRWLAFHSATASLPMSVWEKCRGYADTMPGANAEQLLKEFLTYNREEPCVAGLDLGLTSDTTCLALLWRQVKLHDGSTLKKRVAVPTFWIPEAKLMERVRLWGVPLDRWAREDWINITPGDIVDLRVVKQDILKICSAFRVGEIGYDRWGSAPVFCADLMRDGAPKCVEVPQSPSVLSTPCAEFKRAVFRQEFWHLGNPVGAWMSQNCKLEEDSTHGGIRPQKVTGAEKEKIDYVQALVTAWHRLIDVGDSKPWDGRIRFLEDL